MEAATLPSLDEIRAEARRLATSGLYADHERLRQSAERMGTDTAGLAALVKVELAQMDAQNVTAEVPKLPALPLSQAIERAQNLLAPKTEGSPADYPLAALGPLADAAADLAAGAQVAPAMAGQSLLAVAALLTQSRFNVRTLDGAPKPLSLYALTVANSGDGKDAADRIALSAVRDFQREAGEAYRWNQTEYEQVMSTRKKSDPLPEPLGPAPYRVAADLTIEGLRRSFAEGVSSQGIFSTEAGAVLAGHAMSAEQRTKTAANLCGMWDRGHISVLRAAGGRTERYGVRLSVHMLLQPAALGDVLGDETLAGIGFWPRFLLAWPAPLEPRKYRPWKAESCASIGRYWARCAELLGLPVPDECDTLPTLELDAAATKHMAAFFEAMETEGRKGTLRDVRPFALRAAELACRVAGVLAAFSGRDGIDLHLAECGAELVAHSIDGWQEALAGKADAVPGWALTLYRWLAERGTPIRLKDIPRLGPASVRPAARRDAALDLLQSFGLVDVSNGETVALGATHASR